MSFKQWCTERKKIFQTIGLLLLIGLFSAVLLLTTQTEYFGLFVLLLGLPIYLGVNLDSSMSNSAIIVAFIISGIINVFFIYYLAKGILFVKKLNKKVFVAFTIVALFFLFGLDYQLVKTISAPDVSCTRDTDCVADFNQYSESQCDYLSHNKKWSYYQPLVLRAVAMAMCPSSPPSKCINNTCQLQRPTVNRNV